MANVYFGSDVEDFIFDESASYEEACSSKKEGADEDEEVTDDEMNECGIIECVDDPEVACYRIALENEQNYNMIMNAFMAQEFSVLESTGEEMVYEAVDVKKFFSSLRTFVAKFWAKVQGVFKKVIEKIGSFVISNKTFVQKYKGKDIKIPARDEAFKGYNFSISKSSPGFKAVADLTTKSVDIDKIGTVTGDTIEAEKEKFNKDFESTEKLMRGCMCGNKSKEIDKKDFNKELKIAYFGSEDKVDISSVSFDQIIKALENGDIYKRNAKSAYDNAKSSVKKIQTDIKVAERNLAKSKDKSAGMAMGRSYSKAVNTAINIMSVGLSAYFKAVNAYMAQSKSMGMYYVLHQPKKQKNEEGVGESTIEKELGIQFI